MAQIDRCFNDDSFTTMIQRIQSLSYHYEGRLQLHLIGGFSDRNRVAHSLSVALLRKSISIHNSNFIVSFSTSTGLTNSELQTLNSLFTIANREERNRVAHSVALLT